MNAAQFKCLGVFSVFAVIGFGPISPGCLIGMLIVITRPSWFWHLTYNVYNKKPASVLQQSNALASIRTRLKAFLCLLGLFILDIAPVPITPVVAFFIILSRPAWFFCIVTKIYATKSPT